MLQEFLDKIAVVVVSLFVSEAVRQTVQHAAGPSTSLFESEYVNAASDEPNISSPDNPDSDTARSNCLEDETSSDSEEAINTAIDVHNQYYLVNTTDLAETEVITVPRENNGEQGNTNTEYGAISIPAPNEQPKTLFSSCKTSLCISFTIIVAVIPVSTIMISVLYLDVNTSSICYQQLMNKSLPQKVIKYVITGHDIEGFALNFWFQLMLILLFGWKKFKLHYSSTLLLGFLLGLSVVAYKTTLFLVKIDFTQTKYRYPGNAVFLFGVIYSSYLVAKNVCKTFPSHTRHLKKGQVFVIVSTQFFLGFLIAMAYRYVFVPWFRGTEDDILRTIIAMITPILILLPMVISENLAIQSLPFADEGRIFVLVYFVNGISILLYCIMQAGVNNLSFFIVLSVFRGVLQVFQTATVKIRQKVVIGIWKCLERKCTSCPHLGELEESRYQRRLKVDKEIQIMLYQSAAIIVSQAYLVLYLTSNYHVETREILEECIMKRVIIGIGISFLANCLSLLIHIHYHKTQIAEVWYSNWKLHLSAVTIGGVMSICYFTAVLLSVFERFAHYKEYRTKDCTGPFT